MIPARISPPLEEGQLITGEVGGPGRVERIQASQVADQ